MLIDIKDCEIELPNRNLKIERLTISITIAGEYLEFASSDFTKAQAKKFITKFRKNIYKLMIFDGGVRGRSLTFIGY